MPHLRFKGRSLVENHQLAVPFHELGPSPGEPLPEAPGAQPNLVVDGENLLPLKVLQPTLHRQIKCIDIDPPYNTGKERWVYSDSLNSPTWECCRLHTDLIVTLKPDEPDSDDPFHGVFVLETKGLHLEQAPDTLYTRSVFDLCNEHARRAEWAEFVPAMRGKSTRFEVVDEKEWQQRFLSLLESR